MERIGKKRVGFVGNDLGNKRNFFGISIKNI